MRFDWTQRITGAVGLLLLAYFAAHTAQLLNQKKEAASQDHPAQRSSVSDAKAQADTNASQQADANKPAPIEQKSSGPNSPNIVGSGNIVGSTVIIHPETPAKSAKAEPFAFTEEIPDIVTVLLANGAGIHLVVNLQSTTIQKEKFSGLLNMDGERPLTVYIQDGTFYVDTSITDGSGREAIQIRKNGLAVKPSAWDRNFSSNAVEIVDANQRPIFQMIRKRANLIQVAGLFVSPKGAVFDARPIKPLFKYPAWKYPGKYAEESSDESPDESPGNPYSPKALSQLDGAELRVRTHALCTKIRALGKEWDAGYFKNNEKALQSMNAAKSKEEKEAYGNQRMADNERLFRSLEARFNGEHGRNAKALKAELSHRVDKPIDVFKPPVVPPLLESGIAAGSNPFNDVADYLEKLDGQI